METKRLFLRKFRVSDAKDVYEWAGDEKVAETINFEMHKDVAESKQITKEILMQPDNWAIILKDSNKCIGSIGLIQDKDNHKTQIGYSLNRLYWNKGYVTEALQEIIDYCFNSLKLNRVEAIHYTNNPASGRVMEKAGLKREGKMKQYIYVKGEYKDCIMYGLVREDYKESK